MALRIASVTIDCRNPTLLADFWERALHYVRRTGPGEGMDSVEDPHDRDVELLFIRVPEGKTVKNRVHLDLGADDLEAEVLRLETLGAERVERVRHWIVMRDPEGNEFCVVQAGADDPVAEWRKR